MTNEQDLIQQILGGNQNAFRRLVENHQDLVANTCFGFLQNRADSEDVTQEVFIEVYRNLHHFKGDSKISTWLYRIAVNRSIDFLRKKKRKNWLSNFSSFFSDETSTVELQVPDQRSASAFEKIENEERRSVLANAVQSLPENQRIAFTLSKYEDLSYQMISEVMDLSVSSVESLLFRAKQNLRKKLENYYKNQLD